MLHDLLMLRGRHRLRHGFCPWCYSSPPDPSCPVCHGQHLYGSQLSTEEREAWTYRWEGLMESCR